MKKLWFCQNTLKGTVFVLRSENQLDIYLPRSNFFETISPVIDKCLKAIEESGINANDAQNIPQFLYEAILKSNREARGTTPFKVILTEEEKFLRDTLQ